jgi:hypothetical protein
METTAAPHFSIDYLRFVSKGICNQERDFCWKESDYHDQRHCHFIHSKCGKMVTFTFAESNIPAENKIGIPHSSPQHCYLSLKFFNAYCTESRNLFEFYDKCDMIYHSGCIVGSRLECK